MDSYIDLNMNTLEAKPTDGEKLHDPKMSETRSNTDDDGKVADSFVRERKPRYKNIVHLWEFLLELLADESCRWLITWSRKAHGEFKLKNHEEVAKIWGRLKNRPNMNYEKLSRALRHYYNQGIIKKVPGQRLVYKFHKLPYEYTPGKTRGNPLRTPPASTIRRNEYCFTESPSCAEESERPLAYKERMKRLLEERTNMTRNLEKRTNPKQNEEVRPAGVPSPPAASPEAVPAAVFTSHPYSHPMIPTPLLHLPVCCCTCSLQDVKPRPGYSTQIMFPVSPYKQQNIIPYGLNYRTKSVPVPVITRRY